jgi:RHS repeat-associated protein
MATRSINDVRRILGLWLVPVFMLLHSGAASSEDDVWGYVFNGADLLIEVQLGTNVVTANAYDGEGLRVQRTFGQSTIYYVRDEAGNVVAEYDASGALLAEYVYVAGQRTVRIDASGNRSHYHTDHLGTPLVITDDSGSRSSRAEYRPFGTETDREGASDRYSFTGKEFDDGIGLYYFDARYYDPTIGRFITTDPVLGETSDLQRLNCYSYSLNNPFSYKDPTGMTVTVSGPDSDDMTFLRYALDDREKANSLSASLQTINGKERWVVGNGGQDWTRSKNPNAQLLQAAMDSSVVINFRIDGKMKGHGGGVTKSLGYETSGEIDITMNPWHILHKPTKALSIEANPPYSMDTWRPIPVGPAIMHEFGHAWGYFELGKKAHPLSGAPGFGETNGDAVDWENKSRRFYYANRPWLTPYIRTAH